MAALTALPPFAVNTYAPSISQIARQFHITDAEVLVTFSTYFIGSAIGMLAWGLLTDKFGRKKILLTGLIIYCLSTILCAHSNTFNQLIFFRLIQGLSDSCGVVVALSMIRDYYNGRKLTIALSSMAMIMLFAPIISPIIGSFLVYTTDNWRSSFYFLLSYGLILLIACFFLSESLPRYKRESSTLKIASFFYYHIINFKFTSLSISSGLFFASFFSYSGASAVIYLDIFQTGYTKYVILFSVCILSAFASNFTVKKLSIKGVPLVNFLIAGIIIVFITLLIQMIYLHSLTPNAYVFTFINLFTVYGFSLCSIALASASMQCIDQQFGIATALNNFFKFSLAAAANWFTSNLSGNEVIMNLSLHQLIICTIATILTVSFLKSSVSR